jgi:hypothetical protein
MLKLFKKRYRYIKLLIKFKESFMALKYHETPFHATHKKEIADRMVAEVDLVIAIEEVNRKTSMTDTNVVIRAGNEGDVHFEYFLNTGELIATL